nr:prenyltransferase/squalene oxidase repeat-containing protein [uncultured Desulfobacter sp.]
MRSVMYFMVIVFALLSSGVVAFGAYGNNINNAVQWLSDRQNADGSWGTVQTVKFIHTVEAVQALRAAGYRNDAYFSGITWLENHSADNNDFLSRKALALGSHGDDISVEILQLENFQDTDIPGRDAWGAGPAYISSALDTALVLNTVNALGSGADISAAVSYLKDSQLTGTEPGWPVGLETTSDPFSTAMVIKTLASFQDQDPSLETYITNGLTTLSSKVNTESPVYLQALAAHAALSCGDYTTAQSWIDSLEATQDADGSWSAGEYETALALRALAAADGIDSQERQTTVVIPDQALRTAINASLNRNAIDGIDRAELSRLTNLDAAGMGISDLTGLEWAVNLISADLRNNDITSISPLDGLAQLTDLQLDDNPIYVASNPVPAASHVTLMITALLLICLALLTHRKNLGMNKEMRNVKNLTQIVCNVLLLIFIPLFMVNAASANPESAIQSQKQGLTPGITQQVQFISKGILTSRLKEHKLREQELDTPKEIISKLDGSLLLLEKNLSVSTLQRTAIPPPKENAGKTTHKASPDLSSDSEESMTKESLNAICACQQDMSDHLAELEQQIGITGELKALSVKGKDKDRPLKLHSKSLYGVLSKIENELEKMKTEGATHEKIKALREKLTPYYFNIHTAKQPPDFQTITRHR